VFRKGQLRRLRKRSSSLSSIPLKGGGHYYYNYDEVGGELWAYTINFMIRVKKYGAEPGEEPEILQMIRRAKDPVAAIQPFRPDDPERALVDPLLLLEDSSQSDPDASESVANPWDGSDYSDEP
jgi:hypothetical protein